MGRLAYPKKFVDDCRNAAKTEQADVDAFGARELKEHSTYLGQLPGCIHQDALSSSVLVWPHSRVGTEKVLYMGNDNVPTNPVAGYKIGLKVLRRIIRVRGRHDCVS